MNPASGPDDQILLKGSGKRSRLEISEDDLSSTTTAGRPAAVAPPEAERATRPSAQTIDDDVTITLRRRPLPGGGMVPPAGGPPDQYLHDAPTPWWRTRAATWTAAGLLALVVVSVAGILLLSGGKSDEEVVYAQLTSTHTAVNNVMDDASQARKLADLRAAGESAGTALASLDQPEATIRGLDNPSLTALALDLVAAERLYLQALEGLTKLDRASVTAADASAWRAQRQAIENAQRKVADAGDAVNGLALPGAAEPVILSDAELGSAAQAVNETVTTARDRWRAYRRAMKRYDAAVARAQAKEREINRYRQQVLSALAAYSADRKKVDELVARARDFTSTSDAEAALGEVDDFVSDRQRTITELTNALPLAPTAEVRAAHKNLQSPLSSSLDGLQSLDEALATWASDSVANVQQESTWDDFQRQSDDATQQLNSTSAVWEQTVQSAIKDVKDRGGIPHHPKPPQI